MVPKGAGEPVDPLGTTQHPLTMGEAATYLSVCSLRQPSPAALEGHGKIPGETRDKEEPQGRVSQPNKRDLYSERGF